MNEPLIGGFPPRNAPKSEYQAYLDAAAFHRPRLFDSLNFLQLIRLVGIAGVIGLYIISFYMQHFYVHYVYITYWALHLTFISLILTFASANNKHNTLLRAWALVTLEIAITLSVLSAILYYSVVQEEIYRVYEQGKQEDRNFHRFITALHLAPLVINFLNFILTDMEFLKRDLSIIVFVAIMYIVFNFLVSKLSGVPVYSFLNWTDLRSLISASIFIVALSAIFMVLVLMSAVIPRKVDPYQERINNH